jgi:hypothetical protein
MMSFNVASPWLGFKIFGLRLIQSFYCHFKFFIFADTLALMLQTTRCGIENAKNVADKIDDIKTFSPLNIFLN